MAQNIYDNPEFFEGYAKLNRSVNGLDGAPEWLSLARMLPNMNGLHVVDLGCGYGWFCREAQRQGAQQVTGLDISTKMLNKAREMTTNDQGITYQQEDLEALQLPTAAYDLVYSSLTLHYVENLCALIKVVFHALKPGGNFVFSVEHPIYTAPKEPSWLMDRSGNKSWPVNNYQAEGRRVTNWLAEGVVKQHRLMATYLNLLVASGFVIVHVEEFGPTAEQILRNPALDEEKELPMLLLISARKP
ncbi:uncharacterized protein HI_0912-like [Paramacrobiotus metropolitanus]|uniref:uncharacterized protein HI_0912-like n=1 Tax=Paramacrobiotus metropolitanus TaxID=2943436 RepID=UPI0024461519|nr:uncharacterized protein HI_0912-like [Paramacrobiotus metropolitanus]